MPTILRQTLGPTATAIVTAILLPPAMVVIHCHTLQPITSIDLVTTMPTNEIMSPTTVMLDKATMAMSIELPL